MALSSAAGESNIPKVAQGSLVLQPFEPQLGRDEIALNRVVRAKSGFTIAQLSGFTASTTLNQSEAQLAAWREKAVQALAMQFDGVELEAPGAPQSLATLLDTVQVVSEVWGADRVGVQIAPFAWMSALDDQRPAGPFSELLSELNDMEIAYVHLAGAVVPGRNDLLASPLGRHLRAAFPGILIASGGFTPSTAITAVERRWADMIGFPLPAGDGDDLLIAVRRSAR